MTKNCWEVKQCGREPGGRNIAGLGICPAAVDTRIDGINNGKNGGRVCWAIAGTLCGGKVHGTFASKIANCRHCEFYQTVHRDIQEGDPMHMIDLVLERTIALEHEIEQRKRLEISLRQANNKLNLLSSITRHDMLNKLGAVSLQTELLGHRAGSEPAVAGFLEKTGPLVRDLTEMIWFTSDYQDLGVHEPSWQIVPDVIDGIRSWVHGVTIRTDPALDRYEIFADPLLSKVFYNLADNAVRHGVRISTIQVSGTVRPEGFLIAWQDNGVGIPDEEKERIFKKGHGRNTGLGLFLVREILSITGITIAETGIPGEGARFEMLVPEGSWRAMGS